MFLCRVLVVWCVVPLLLVWPRPPRRADEYLTAAAKHPECSGGVSKQVREELVAVRLALKAKEDAFGRGFSAAFSGGGATGAT